jgi:hypothetical protein
LAVGPTKARVRSSDGIGQKMPFIKILHNRECAVTVMLLISLSIAVIQASLVAAPLQQKAPNGEKQKRTEGAAAKRSDEKSETSGKEDEPASAPRISLGEIVGSPGASLTIPFYYTPSANQPLRSFVVDIEFVSNHLEFQKAAAGVAPKGGEPDIGATITRGDPDEKGITRSKVRISVSLKNKNSQKGLPQGLLAFLLFQVTMDAKPFAIKLSPTVVSAEDLHTPPRKVTTISTSPGMVAVEIPNVVPKATCFFFSH